MAKLLLVRHGETRPNSLKRFCGKTDVELSEAGVRQVEQLRDRLASQKIAAVYASNLKRASTTAAIIAATHQLDVVTCPELNEIDFGEFEGLTFEEITQRHPEVAAELLNWSISPRFPGGENADEVNARVSRFLPRLARYTPEETVLIVAHAGTLRMLICNLLGMDVRHWRQLRVDLGSVSTVETYPRGGILTLLNDVSHLK